MNQKVYITAFVFIGLTVVKLLFPDYTEDYRGQIVKLIEWDMDYRGMVATVGSLLTYEPLQEVFGNLGIDIPAYGTTEVFSSDLNSEIADSDDVAEEMVVEDSVPEVDIANQSNDPVAAFLLSQELYEGHEIPDNVSFNDLSVPFDYSMPITGVQSSGFGYRVHPIDQQVTFHYGTDFAVAEGEQIYAFSDGEVIAVTEEVGYGKYVLIAHSEGWESLYAHCSELLVTVGQQVSQGEVIALSGKTGRVTGPHLHFELRHDGCYTNPEFYF